MVKNAVFPTTSFPFTTSGQGVPERNIEVQISVFWHIRDTAATAIPKSFKTLASLRRLHSASCLYVPEEIPSRST